MKQVEKITAAQLQKMAQSMYGDMVKAVVDIQKKLLVVDAPMHVDIEQFLLESGSKQMDLWGINLHPDKYGSANFVEFDSMINIRPRQNNMSRDVENPVLQKTIRDIVGKIVHE